MQWFHHRSCHYAAGLLWHGMIVKLTGSQAANCQMPHASCRATLSLWQQGEVVLLYLFLSSWWGFVYPLLCQWWKITCIVHGWVHYTHIAKQVVNHVKVNRAWYTFSIKIRAQDNGASMQGGDFTFKMSCRMFHGWTIGEHTKDMVRIITYMYMMIWNLYIIIVYMYTKIMHWRPKRWQNYKELNTLTNSIKIEY